MQDIQVIFGFHLSAGYALRHLTYSGEFKGNFASRSPRRPSPLGVSTVELLGIEDNVLRVKGLDAVHGTPVYDIKPFAPVYDAPTVEQERLAHLRRQPRREFMHAVRSGDGVRCLLKAAEFHGHFCPGLALGVAAALLGLKEMGLPPHDADGGGAEDLIAVVETRSAFADGIQAAAGCTFGNGGLVFRNLGELAATFALRGRGRGIRVRARESYSELVEKKLPGFTVRFSKALEYGCETHRERDDVSEMGTKAAFVLVGLPLVDLLAVDEVAVDLPV